jgi:EAL domain-containing protein (putative c-di-GMP-specific phosphodiesterase class I)
MLLPQLKRAIELRKLQMYFQPICNSSNGAVRGFEALARWTMDNGEFVSPGEFIPLAEEAGLIHDIGLWAVESAAIQIQALNRLYAEESLYVSVNIDAGTLDDSRFLGKVISVFKDYSLQSGQLKIELTERGLIKDTEAIIPKMQELIAQGCEFMIDDFGTGYSSLSYLHKLPIHTLKIDRSFVLGLDESDTSEAVVKTIITLSESLGLNVVAEGVETIENVVQLASLNCHQLQGYYFSRPMPAAEVEGFLEEHELLSSALYQQAGSFTGEKSQPLN